LHRIVATEHNLFAIGTVCSSAEAEALVNRNGRLSTPITRIPGSSIVNLANQRWLFRAPPNPGDFPAS
jgi:hypothetical protein